MIKRDQPNIFNSLNLQAIVSSKSDGNTKPEWGPLAQTTTNIEKIIVGVGAELENVVIMNVGADQTHWDTIREVTIRDSGAGGRDPKTRIVADALVTNTPGLALLLPTADCNPVIMYDPTHHALALVHLGWQSTVAGLAQKTLSFMRQAYNVDPAQLLVYFGPAIKATSYVFDAPLDQADDLAWQPFLQKTPQGIGIDLGGYNRQQLYEVGVKPAHVQICPVDTATSADYFSHYRSVRTGEPEGRFATVCKLNLKTHPTTSPSR